MSNNKTLKISAFVLIAIAALVALYFTVINPPEDKEFVEEVEQTQQAQDDLDDFLNNLPDPAENSGSEAEGSE